MSNNALDSFSTALLDAGRPRAATHTIKGAIAPKLGKTKGKVAKAAIVKKKATSVAGRTKPRGFGVR